MTIVTALGKSEGLHSLAEGHVCSAHVAWAWLQGRPPMEAWRQWASDVSAWLHAQQVDPREAWVVLPVGALLVQARQAWAHAVGGWLPRIDTIAGLASAQAWAHMPQPWSGPLADAFAGPVTLDSVLDRLHARRSLAMQAWAMQWARRDPRGFDFAVDQVVDAAQTWLRHLQACAPEVRGERVSGWREALSKDVGAVVQGPGHREALLLAWALEWAAASAQQGFASDILFAGPGRGGPTAWVAVHAGETVAPGSEGALTLAVLSYATAQGLPVLRVVASPVCAKPSARGGEEVVPELRASGDVQVSLLACTDMLDEARQAAAATLLAVNAARQRVGLAGAAAAAPVALIALDRGVVRHARALLEDAGVSLADETGWLLSTTRAATAISRLLSASNPRASTDELLDWLKSGWLHWSGAEGVVLADAVGQLETWCRRHGLVSAWGLGELMSSPPMQVVASAIGQSLSPDGVAVWQWAHAAVAPLQEVWRDRQAHLADWLIGLHVALSTCGAKASLLEDAAGQLAWAALHLDEFLPDGQHQAGDVWSTRADGSDMQRWVREVLEEVTFRPAAPEGQPDVVITTLARAVLRPFDAIVMPGADERQLGALSTATGWLGQRMREVMGLSTAVQLREAQWEAFQLLFTQPRVTCLYRKAQGSEPLEASPWLARWAQSQSQEMDAILVVDTDPRPLLAVPVKPVTRPAPTLHCASVGLPAQVSATTYEQLRQCPYRFFAVTVLGLRRADELQEGVEASEYGTWLHEVLRRFHEARCDTLAQSDADEDVAHWLAVAHGVSNDLGMASEGLRAHFLPFAAALPAMARAYVTWQRQHEADGWRVRATEASITRALPLDDGSTLQLYGQLDRIDVRHEPHTDGGPRCEVRWVLDYKTGNAAKLSQRANAGSEDTQLAFYAALGGDDDGLRAGYVHLDPTDVKVLEHADVAKSAQALLHGLASDWQRLRNGSPLPALGEGAACGYCHARGLCRRDHWSGDSA